MFTCACTEFVKIRFKIFTFPKFSGIYLKRCKSNISTNPVIILWHACRKPLYLVPNCDELDTL